MTKTSNELLMACAKGSSTAARALPVPLDHLPAQKLEEGDAHADVADAEHASEHLLQAVIAVTPFADRERRAQLDAGLAEEVRVHRPVEKAEYVERLWTADRQILREVEAGGAIRWVDMPFGDAGDSTTDLPHGRKPEYVLLVEQDFDLKPGEEPALVFDVEGALDDPPTVDVDEPQARAPGRKGRLNLSV